MPPLADAQQADLTERQADQRAAKAIVQARIESIAPLKKKSIWHRFRSAITGLFVSKQHAEANPSTTVRERVD